MPQQEHRLLRSSGKIGLQVIAEVLRVVKLHARAHCLELPRQHFSEPIYGALLAAGRLELHQLLDVAQHLGFVTTESVDCDVISHKLGDSLFPEL